MVDQPASPRTFVSEILLALETVADEYVLQNHRVPLYALSRLALSLAQEYALFCLGQDT